MEKVLTDAFGVPLKVGQEIAYATCYGSRVRIKKGVIDRVNENSTLTVRKETAYSWQRPLVTVEALDRVFVNLSAGGVR